MRICANWSEPLLVTHFVKSHVAAHLSFSHFQDNKAGGSRDRMIHIKHKITQIVVKDMTSRWKSLRNHSKRR